MNANPSVTYCPKVTNAYDCREAPFDRALYAVKEGRWSAEVNGLRTLENPTDEERRDYKADRLPAFLWSGLFSYRRETSLRAHSGLVVLDFDHLSVGADDARERIAAVPGCVGAFVSPGGDGVKALMLLAKEPRAKVEHEAAWFASQMRVHLRTGFEVDISGKDMCRACFVSFDPDCYIGRFADEDAVSWSVSNYDYKALDRAAGRKSGGAPGVAGSRHHSPNTPNTCLLYTSPSPRD